MIGTRAFDFVGYPAGAEPSLIPIIGIYPFDFTGIPVAFAVAVEPQAPVSPLRGGPDRWHPPHLEFASEAEIEEMLSGYHATVKKCEVELELVAEIKTAIEQQQTVSLARFEREIELSRAVRERTLLAKLAAGNGISGKPAYNQVARITPELRSKARAEVEAGIAAQKAAEADRLRKQAELEERSILAHEARVKAVLRRVQNNIKAVAIILAIDEE